MRATLQSMPWYTILVVLLHGLLTAWLLHWTAQRLLPHYMPTSPHAHCHYNNNHNTLSYCLSASEADQRNTATLTVATRYHALLAVLTFLVLSYGITAPFGRHARTPRWHSLPRFFLLPARFSWLLQELPTLLSIVYFVSFEYPRAATVNTTHPWSLQLYVQLVWQACMCCRWSLGLFIVHYIHRACLYPCFLSAQAMPVPLPVTLSATLYCMLNGRLQLLANLKPYHTAPHHKDHLVDVNELLLAVVAVTVFALGMRINTQSDYYLLSLKRRHAGRYAIPHGAWFTYVSCPNFLGELIEWIGYTLAVYAASFHVSKVPSLAAASFALYTLANLLPRARAHHAWYLARFPGSYAKLKRKALIPYLC